MAEPIVNLPSLYVQGLKISNNATTPNTKVDVSLGQARDSTNVFDITLSAGVTIDASQNGAVNRLDTGSLAASTMYAIFVIADSSGFNATGALMSLSTTAPTLPFGYDIFRRIGMVLTDGSSHILKFYQTGLAGNQNIQARYMQYDAPIAVTVTSSGTSATYSAMDLSVAVPLANFGEVGVYYKYTPNAAADTLKFQPSGATGDYLTVTATGTVAQDNMFKILPLVVSSVPKISYKVSAGTLNSILVSSYVDML